VEPGLQSRRPAEAPTGACPPELKFRLYISTSVPHI
jgi:hypothetical protein